MPEAKVAQVCRSITTVPALDNVAVTERVEEIRLFLANKVFLVRPRKLGFPKVNKLRVTIHNV